MEGNFWDPAENLLVSNQKVAAGKLHTTHMPIGECFHGVYSKHKKRKGGSHFNFCSSTCTFSIIRRAGIALANRGIINVIIK